jgi:hypothetical protein
MTLGERCKKYKTYRGHLVLQGHWTSRRACGENQMKDNINMDKGN